MIKTIIITFLFLLSLEANEFNGSKPLSYQATDLLLKSIEKDAIIYGSGDKVVSVFLDPLCKFSRKFISTITHNSKMLSEYRYYIYLYSIPRLHSNDTVSAIYLSNNQVETLLEIMIEGKSQNTIGNLSSQERTQRIASIAQKIGVNKRPFLFIQK